MVTREELFAAVRLIKENCNSYGGVCRDTRKEDLPLCDLFYWCPYYNKCNRKPPYKWELPEYWPDQEEGGGEDVQRKDC